MKAIKGRRSIRVFKDQPVPDELLLKLVEAGVWAPTGGNAQNWLFIAVRDRERIAKIKAVSPGILAVPAALIVVCVDKERAYKRGGKRGRDLTSVMDAAMASQNIMLRAFEEGLGSCAVLSFHKPGVKKLLHLPEGIEPELLIQVGYPAEDPKPPQRKFKEVLFFETYNER